jgi:hypothetical protein
VNIFTANHKASPIQGKRHRVDDTGPKAKRASLAYEKVTHDDSEDSDDSDDDATAHDFRRVQIIESWGNTLAAYYPNVRLRDMRLTIEEKQQGEFAEEESQDAPKDTDEDTEHGPNTSENPNSPDAMQSA